MVNNFKNSGELKKEMEELFKIKGEVRGAGVRGAYLYLKDKIKEEQIKMVDKKINELGYPIKIEEVRAMSWYPVGLAGAYLLVAK